MMKLSPFAIYFPFDCFFRGTLSPLPRGTNPRIPRCTDSRHSFAAQTPRKGHSQAPSACPPPPASTDNQALNCQQLPFSDRPNPRTFFAFTPPLYQQVTSFGCHDFSGSTSFNLPGTRYSSDMSPQVGPPFSTISPPPLQIFRPNAPPPFDKQKYLPPSLLSSFRVLFQSYIDAPRVILLLPFL